MSLQCAASCCGRDAYGFVPAFSWDNGDSRKMATESIPVEAAPAQDQKADPAAAEELELVTQARRGESSAFSTLIRRYEGKIFRLAMNITQNREDAEDVLQEAFIKAYEHLDQFQGNSKFYTWVVRIAVNQALMKLRKRKSDRAVSLDEQIDTGEDTMVREIAAWDPDPEQQYSQDELRGILSEAVDGLEPIYKTVFTLRDVDGLSTEETAEALDLTGSDPRASFGLRRPSHTSRANAHLKCENRRRSRRDAPCSTPPTR